MPSFWILKILRKLPLRKPSTIFCEIGTDHRLLFSFHWEIQLIRASVPGPSCPASFLQALLVTHKPDTIPPFISPTAYVHKLFIERSRGVTTANMDMKWNVNFRHLWGKNEENYFIYKSLELKKRKNVISVIDVSCLTHLTFSPLTSCKLISPPSLWSKPLPPSLWPKPYPICLALAIISLCNFLF